MPCWFKDKLSPDECPYIDPESESELLKNVVKRLKEKCFCCPKFIADLAREGVEPRLSIFEITFPKVLFKSSESFESFEEFKKRMKGFLTALSYIKEALTLEEVVHVALTLLTAREGFGFNRAIYFDVKNVNEKLTLVARYGIGPKYPSEGKLWEVIGSIPLEELLSNKEVIRRDTAKLQSVLESLVVSIDEEHPVGKAFLEKVPQVFHFEKGKEQSVYEILTILGTTSFGILPIWCKDRPIGMIMVDNIVDMAPVDERKLKMAQGLIDSLSLALDRVKLLQEYRDRIKELEEMRDEIEKQHRIIVDMEKALSLKEVSSRISHEIRNPLTVIGGLARRMLKKGEYDKASLEQIVKEVDKISNLLDDIDVYNKSVSPNKVTTDVKYVIKETVRNIRKIYPDFKVELIMPKGFIEAKVDPKHLSKLVENALINAYEAHIKKGVNLPIKLKLRIDGDNMIIEVEDRGGGIPEKIKDKIFEPFFTTKENGTGMGIPVMTVIVREHGGSIEIENIEDGARVRIRLPI